MRARTCFAWFLSLSLCQPLLADVVITQDGQPRATVVLTGSAAAGDLSTKALVGHLKQMSGATLAVVHEKELSGASVDNDGIIPAAGGKLAANFIVLGEGELTKRLGASTEGLGLGGIMLKSGGNFIVIAGMNDDIAAKSRDPNTMAVFTFLESLGCRFLWPGESGKVIPKKPTISVASLDVRFTPPIGQRKIRFAGLDARGAAEGLTALGLTLDDYKKARDAASLTESDGSWEKWHGLGGNIGVVGGAAGYGLRGGWDEHGAAHPEWFALQPDGTRDQSNAKGRWRLCISNPGLVEHVANDVLTRLNGKAQAAISLCPNDGGYSNFCLCEACNKLDAPNAPKVRMLIFKKVGESERSEVEHVALTDRFVHYWNAVVERVTKVVPDQLFLVEAYSYYSDPPMREKLHPNLVLRYVPNSADGWKGWQAAGAKRVYWRPNNLHSGHYDGALSPRARENSETLRYLAASGMLATDMDSLYHHWATQGLHYYMMAKLSWNPTQEYDALLDDFCKTGFGAGAEEVRQYFLLAEKGIVLTPGKRVFPQITDETMAALRAHLVAAAKATEGDAAAHRRVAFLRAGFEFTAASREAHRLADEASGGGKPDPKIVNEVMDRRWQMMRGLLQNHPLAVNVGVVAAADGAWTRALSWKGPTEGAKTGKLVLKPEDDWLNGDQSATRK
ncbi:DUF4838 domain-containing protein [Prosthecobacter sp.]|uniref:DUF4838 domain-containing protein n=1 Tax=Prosthecobacter sp. TaxID=1965333 RepID=UPI0037832E93